LTISFLQQNFTSIDNAPLYNELVWCYPFKSKEKSSVGHGMGKTMQATLGTATAASLMFSILNFGNTALFWGMNNIV